MKEPAPHWTDKYDVLPDLNIDVMVNDLLAGRPLSQLSSVERDLYYSWTSPLTLGTASEITDAQKHDASARQNMATNHMGQAIPTIKTGKRLFWNGPERNYGRAMFDETMDGDCEVLAVVPRYLITNPLQVASPYDLVIYQTENSKGQPEIRFFTTEKYRSSSLKFGYELDFSDVRGELRAGGFIPGGQIIGRNSACSKEGDYQYAHEVNVLFCTSNYVSEDQYWMSDEIQDLFAFRLYGEKQTQYPRNCVALDLYGKGERYQACPLPGQRVRPDGLLMAFRKNDTEFPWIDFTKDGLRQVYDGTDRKLHVDQSMVGYAEVYDVVVTRGARKNARNVLTGTTDVFDALAYMDEDFHGRVIEAYRNIKARYYNNQHIPLGFEFGMFLSQSMIRSRHTEYSFLSKLKQYADRINTTMGNVVIGDYAINFKLTAVKRPNSGDKVSDTHGTKGVMSLPTKAEDMPYLTLPNGTVLRTQLALSWITVVKRMNMGQMFTFEVAWYKDWVLDSLIPEYKRGNLKKCWDTILTMYRCVSPYAAKAIAQTLKTKELRDEHVNICMNGGLVFFNPNHESRLWEEKITELQKAFPFVKELPITFRGRDGIIKTTKMPGKIASKAMVILEKHPEVIASGSSIRNHFGQPATVTKDTRNEHQIKKQSVRGMSETEGQAWLGVCGQEFTAESFDRTTNMLTNQHIVDTVINAIAPTAVPNLVDRAAIPLGSSKTISLLNNSINAWGWGLERQS